jgi:hypothetical protein
MDTQDAGVTVIETLGGDHIYDTLAKAVELAPATFNFNGMSFQTRVGETMGDARQRFKDENGFEVLTHEESVERARRQTAEAEAKWAKAIAEAGVATEAEMRTQKAPTPNSVEELSDYIEALVKRPHDYGTCVYAMSLAATAAFNFIASKLGVSGFQASCADMDILRQTRGFEWGRIVSYDNLLYPQYCDDEHFSPVTHLLADDEIRIQLAEKARSLLEDSEHAHPEVKAHWEMLASFATA